MDLCFKQAGNKPIFLPSIRTYSAVQLLHLNLKYKTFEVVTVCYQDNSNNIYEFIKNWPAFCILTGRVLWRKVHLFLV